jgi:hypothetical protein
LSAAFLSRGHQLQSDDIATFEQQGKCVNTLPGLPWTRMRRSTLVRLMPGRTTLRNITPRTRKQVVDLLNPKNQFWGQPTPLSVICILQPLKQANALVSEQLVAGEAVIELVKNTYPNARFTLPPSAKNTELKHIGMLCQSVPVIRFRYRKTFSVLDELYDAIVGPLAMETLRA